MAIKIQLRRDTSTNWESKNPTLNIGEPGYATDTKILKIGDGSTKWNELKGTPIDIDTRVSELEDAVFPLTVSVTGSATYEKGTTQTVTVGWTVKKGTQTVEADSVTVNDEPASGNSKQFTEVSTTTTYTVKATYQSKQVTGTAKATFVAPMYFGFAANENVSGGLTIDSLNKQSIKTSPNGTYTLNNSTSGHYLWLCVPNSMTINKVTSSGFDVPMLASESGSTSFDSYKCYRSAAAIDAGNITITIS